MCDDVEAHGSLEASKPLDEIDRILERRLAERWMIVPNHGVILRLRLSEQRLPLLGRRQRAERARGATERAVHPEQDAQRLAIEIRKLQIVERLDAKPRLRIAVVENDDALSNVPLEVLHDDTGRRAGNKLEDDALRSR